VGVIAFAVALVDVIAARACSEFVFFAEKYLSRDLSLIACLFWLSEDFACAETNLALLIALVDEAADTTSAVFVSSHIRSVDDSWYLQAAAGCHTAVMAA